MATGDTWRFYGPEAILIEFGGGKATALRRVASACQAISSHPPNGLRDYVPGFSKLLLIFEPSLRRQLPSRAAEIVNTIISRRTPRIFKPRLHELEVVYDGPDLEFVCEKTGLNLERLIALHSRPLYTVGMLGFSPGFPYLTPLDRRLHLGRRDVPRKWIEPGSVAIGGPHTGIYSIASPGGWHLLGRTNAALFVPENLPEEMFLLAPGDKVRLRPVNEFSISPSASSQK